MKTKQLLMAFAAPIILVAVPADAATHMFDMTGAYNASFMIDESRLTSPDFSDENQFVLDGVTGTFGGVTGQADSITFNLSGFDGGLNIQLGDDFFDFRGPQLFSGTTVRPTFLTGTFNLIDNSDPSRTARLSIAAVPEPVTWSMMVAGFAMTGYTMRRTRTRTRIRVLAKV